MEKKEEEGKFSYYGLYLRNYLKKNSHPRQDDEDFISERAEQAEIQLEKSRRDGLTPDQAQELAMSVLMKGLD